MPEKPRKLNLGSGSFYKEGFVNLDYRADVGAEIVHNLNSGPLPFPDNTFEHAEADHLLEHVENPFALLRELHRVVAPGGTVSIRVPHFSRGFSHPEHEHGFDVSLPLYFDPVFKGGYEGVHFIPRRVHLSWFAQLYLKKITLPSYMYYFGRIFGAIIDVPANLSPFFCSRVWCFWVGGFEEIHFLFEVDKHA